MSQRYKITIEYSGEGLAGFQEQANVKTVQGVIQEAIESFSGEKVKIFGSGRTDAGVHALGQVAHFDLEKNKPEDEIVSALNHFIQKESIAILDCITVNQEFHARFSTKKRSYLYKIVNRKAPLTVEQGLAWQVIKPLDLQAMREATQLLIGHHDFQSFRSTHCQAINSNKTLDEIRITATNDRIELFFSAQSFLHNQVRIMVGTLKKIGHHDYPPKTINDIFLAKCRTKAGPTAPPHGLYFLGPTY
jgi:tRNA pseudouridine38-40 synthase